MVTSGETRERWHVVSYHGGIPFKQVRIRDESLVKTVIEHLKLNRCVALLGAPFSEKTELLKDVAFVLQSAGDSRPLYLDLQETQSDSEVGFFASLASLMCKSLGGLPDVQVDDVLDPRSFRDMLTACRSAANCRLILLIDHLQAMPHALVHGLLLALRAAFMEQSSETPNPLVVVVAGGTRLMGLSASPTSPFNIATPVVVGPLSQEQTLALAGATLGRSGIPASSGSLKAIAEWAKGDRYLVPWLCAESVTVARGHKKPVITTAIVRRVTERLLLIDDATPPLRAAIQTIEEDPDAVLDIVQILEHGTLPQSRSRRMLTRTGTDRLQLSGALALVDEVYRIKNRAFREALTRYFTPERVTHVLRTAGRWHAVLDFLTAQLSLDGRSAIRSLLFETIIQSINVTDSLQEAFSNLTRGLEKGGGLKEIGIYKVSQIHGKLELVNSGRAESPPTLPSSIDLDDSTGIEVQTFHYGSYALRGTVDEARLLVSLIGRQRPIGLVIIRLDGLHLDRDKMPSGLADILSFLQQSADAIANVMTRSAYRKIVQATLGADVAQVLEVVCETLGSDSLRMHLLNHSRTSLDLAFSLSSNQVTKQRSSIPLDQSSNHPAVECLRQQQMLVVRGSDHRLIANADEPGLRSRTLVFYPLHTKDRQIGVLELGFFGGLQAGSGSPMMQDLVTFADQIAIAVLQSQFLPQSDEGSTSIPRPSPAARRRSHLEQQLEELNNNYSVWTRRIAAADKDISQAATSLQRQILQEQKRDLEIEREQFLAKMIKMEEELAQS